MRLSAALKCLWSLCCLLHVSESNSWRTTLFPFYYYCCPFVVALLRHKLINLSLSCFESGCLQMRSTFNFFPCLYTARVSDTNKNHFLTLENSLCLLCPHFGGKVTTRLNCLWLQTLLHSMETGKFSFLFRDPLWQWHKNESNKNITFHFWKSPETKKYVVKALSDSLRSTIGNDAH